MLELKTRLVEEKVGNIDAWLQNDEEVAKQIIRNFSEINVDYNWYEYSIEDFTNEIAKLGFNVETEDVLFRGFYSQGDGASFTGNIDIIEYLKATKQLTKYSALRRAVENGSCYEHFEIVRKSSHYCHENTCVVEYLEYFEDEMGKKAKEQAEELEAELEEKRYELCMKIYNRLDEEYSYLTSKEGIVETLRVNEYEFTEQAEIA